MVCQSVPKTINLIVKKGRLISTGRAIKSPITGIDITNIAERDLCDTFVQNCKEYAQGHDLYTEYQRKKKNKKQTNNFEVLA